MKLTKISVAALMVLSIAACNVFKKHTKPAASAPSVMITVQPKPKDGVFAPGNEELVAIQAKYKDVTMKTLSEGHKLYTGVCTGCHAPKSIYSRAADAWPKILNDMAREAKITDAQKDAVFKYVMAIKATQPK
ncbi:MAG: hypothetical protein JWQ38_2537 [Flavipsychrobacter sp.]|nr:hypothetical protein [Flavipsychrobacter sp.]